MIILQLKKGKEKSIERKHPWIFSGAIGQIKGQPEEGDTVRLENHEGRFIAMGHYQKSSLALRILSFEEVAIDAAFWHHKLSAAIHTRQICGLSQRADTNVYRLVHGEGDGLPGLIVDYYNGLVVMQCHSVGMYNARQIIADALVKILGDKLHSIYDKSEGTIPFKADTTAENGFLYGQTDNSEVIEYGHRFLIEPVDGQKTGFFIDQRENRKLLQQYVKDKKVLNTFCYSGGFSVFALEAGATHVTSVDSSAKAIALVDKNIELNFGKTDKHLSVGNDVGAFLTNDTEKYDVIILDPPAYAKHNNALDNALKGYARLNKKGFEALNKGGILFTFSCSQVVTKDDFRRAVFTAAAQSGKTVKILHQLHQPEDHPISIYHPEGEYLKGFVLYVE
jgi:23S rRNA (cytosine1962-C5)-methyltransferase